MSTARPTVTAGTPPTALRTLLQLALPMVLARATQSVMTFADALQVSHLGAGAIAATATGGMNTFVVVMIPMGTVFIVQSFVAQLVGRGDRAHTGRFAYYGLAIAVAAGLLALAAIPAVGPILSHSSYSPGVQRDMATYMSIRLLSVTAIVVIESLGSFYGGLGNTYMAMIAGIIAMVVNIALNWVLIDGNLGAPAMGVAGTALATTIGTWCGAIFMLVAFWSGRGGAPARVRPRGLSFAELRRVVRFGLPTGVNYFMEFAAFQIFINVLLAGLGDTTVAAMNVVIAINSIAFMPAFGLASAGAILAGTAIGNNERDRVGPAVRLTMICNIVWMLAITALYLIAPARLLGLFAGGDQTAALVTVGAGMLVISAANQLFDAIAMTLAETLRAAGDTTWTMAVRLALAWLVFLPSGYLVIHVFHGGAIGAMVCLAAYMALTAGALVYRYRSGAWRSIDLIEPALV